MFCPVPAAGADILLERSDVCFQVVVIVADVFTGS